MIMGVLAHENSKGCGWGWRDRRLSNLGSGKLSALGRNPGPASFSGQ